MAYKNNNTIPLMRTLQAIPRRVVCDMILFYQKHTSPHFLAGQCRFRPTCSEYALEAIQHFGLLRGGLLAVRRFGRCNPFFPGGRDPVPSYVKLDKE